MWLTNTFDCVNLDDINKKNDVFYLRPLSLMCFYAAAVTEESVSSTAKLRGALTLPQDPVHFGYHPKLTHYCTSPGERSHL